ncbi:interferon-induced helicase C domain-containing protein 1 isoform X2 [Acipenser ruthenus]|uniref:interferon-induced helicase C domain-containing protein 1 isoform X2 n=1 Tax=Acipenser ruthenus TaxID=7906 RepID=UPI00145AB6CB|nr:interferon-induced helicase C domain-containing protein 1 isoform X2 [Acipenser ruthenus]
MTTADENGLWLIRDCFMNKLKHLIRVEPVLDFITFIQPEDKETIRRTAKEKGDISAAELLLQTIVNKPRSDGWLREFVTALESAGCKYAAKYVDPSELPPPSLEATNDYCTRLIELLAPDLVDKMNAKDVACRCYAQNILTQEDNEKITAEVTNSGNTSGARLLLKRIVQTEAGWFSNFLEVLRFCKHEDLAEQLTGVNIFEPEEGQTVEEDGKPGVLVADQEPVVNEEQSEQDNSISLDNEKSLNNSLADNDSNPEESIGDESGNLESDLYSADAEAKGNERLSENEDVSPDQRSQADATDEGGAKSTGFSELDIRLRHYQMEVALPALEGKNIIICLPTGSGKTRVAVYITGEHLVKMKANETPGKVVVLVNKVPLVEQHYRTEFGKFLKHLYKVEKVSGDSQLKISFSDVVKKTDILICTAQILENSLSKANKEDEEGVLLSDFSLMIIDECHHTQKAGVYNSIMTRYINQKMKNMRLRKENKKEMPLPQILGLTASPGVGGARKQSKAEEHILKICANLDAYKIMTVQKNAEELGEKVKEPYKTFAIAEERREDPFGDVIKRIMQEIHKHCTMHPSSDPGTQNYEQWAVQKEKTAAKEENQRDRVCAEHLRKYNDTLQLNDTIRMADAFDYVKNFYKEVERKKFQPDEETGAEREISETDRVLFELFRDNQKELEELSRKPEYENEKLAQLRKTILEQFTRKGEARGIIFTKTRQSAIALHQWIKDNDKFDEVGVKANYLIGAGHNSIVKPMTPAEQRDVIEKFRTGEINLIVATTVAEEGLDIKQCNIVIRYGLVTNEIAMVQARGRARADESTYALVAQEGTGVVERESVNSFRETMMNKAIAKVQKLPQAEYMKKILGFQMQSIVEKKVQAKKKQQKVLHEDPSKLKFLCKGCNRLVCSGENIEVIEDSHHVNVTEAFKELFVVSENKSLQKRLLDYQVNGDIECKHCTQKWGTMMLHRGVECPCLGIRHFVVVHSDKDTKTYNKWNELKTKFTSFDYVEHVSLADSGSDDD